MSSTKQLARRVERLERELKKVLDILELSPVTNPFNWQDLTELDKEILTFLLNRKYKGATTTEIAKSLNLDNPESSGRTIIWRRLKRITKISIGLKGAPVVVTNAKRWLMNYDEFTFTETETVE